MIQLYICPDISRFSEFYVSQFDFPIPRAKRHPHLFAVTRVPLRLGVTVKPKPASPQSPREKSSLGYHGEMWRI